MVNIHATTVGERSVYSKAKWYPLKQKYIPILYNWAILKNILPILSHPKSTIWCNTRSLSINGFHAITWWSVFIFTWKCVFTYMLPFCWTFVLGILKVNILTASIKKKVHCNLNFNNDSILNADYTMSFLVYVECSRPE